MKAIIYTRFSPRRNAGECESCEVQEAYCEQLAAKKGYEVAGIFHDRDASGADEFREVLWRAIEAIEKGSVLLVFKRDRLARNVYLSEQINRAVMRNGGTIEAVTGDVDGNGDEHVLIRQVLAAIAEYERKMIAKRTRYAMQHHQRNGRRMGRYAPYGWRIDPADQKRLIPVPAEVEAVNRVSELHAHGKGAVAIAAALNAECPQASRSGRWSHKTVVAITRRLGG